MMMRWIEWRDGHEGRPHGIIQSASIVQNNHLQNGNQDNDAFGYDGEKTTEHYVEEDEDEEKEDNIEETLMAVLITNNWTGGKNEKLHPWLLEPKIVICGLASKQCITLCF